jgi:hypothetical protein
MRVVPDVLLGCSVVGAFARTNSMSNRVIPIASWAVLPRVAKPTSFATRSTLFEHDAISGLSSERDAKRILIRLRYQSYTGALVLYVSLNDLLKTVGRAQVRCATIMRFGDMVVGVVQ